MPPKRASTSGSSSAGTGSSGSSSSGSSSSSSGSSSSSSGDEDENSDDESSSDSDSSANSKKSKKSTRSASSASSASSSVEKKNKKSGEKKKSTSSNSKKISAAAAIPASSAEVVAATTRSRSASVASESDSSQKKKSSRKSKKSATKGQSPAQPRKVAPKKSATAKPMPKSTALPKKGQLSDNDSDDFGDFSLSKFSAKAKQAKKVASSLASTASSSSAGNTPNAVATPTAIHGVSNSPSLSTTPSSSNKNNKIVPANQSKYKSIFSESSDDSDEEVTINKKSIVSKKKSPSPPRLTPQKKGHASKAKSASLTSKAGPKKKNSAPIKTASPPKRVTRATSSEASSSQSSSHSSSDSSDSEVKFAPATHTSPKKKVSPAVAGRKKAGAVKTAGAAILATANKGKKKGSVMNKKAITAAAIASTDSDGEKTPRPTTRQTRGGAPRRSKHITGHSKMLVDTDSEPEQMSGNLSPRKKTTSSAGTTPNPSQNGATYSVQLQPVRRDLDGLLPIETRKCPVPGCDSSGHLGGRFDRHFLQDACPIYHNSNRKECRDFKQEFSKKQQARKKALTQLATKSPVQSPSSEQRKHAQKIKDNRSTHRSSDLPSVGGEEQNDEREVDLKPFASDWDIKLFREAQALASEDLENSLKGLPDTKTTKYIELGKYEMEVWYQSPYPEDFTCLPRIFICEFCLKYMKNSTTLKRHATKCVWKHPPGDEIYRKDKISVFEICGKRYKQYCQSLCLLAKFFLDHKTLYFDVEPFLFYVMTTADSEGCHFVGYFSKEKNSFQNYNVSCILTLPCHQRQGYGKLLIDFSYLLSRMENKIGSPEKPLSDLGLITYRAYWKDVILEYICNYPERELSIKNFSEEMGINSYDIVSTLQYLGMIKYWKGQHVILKKEDLIEEYMRKTRNRPKGRQIYENALKWKPYEPSAKERRQAEKIKKSQEERQKKR